jgi:hypothetical protein
MDALALEALGLVLLVSIEIIAIIFCLDKILDEGRKKWSR